MKWSASFDHAANVDVVFDDLNLRVAQTLRERHQGYAVSSDWRNGVPPAGDLGCDEDVRFVDQLNIAKRPQHLGTALDEQVRQRASSQLCEQLGDIRLVRSGVG